MNARGVFFLDERDGEVDFLLDEQVFQVRRITFAQRNFQRRKFFSQIAQQARQMVPQDDGRGADANVARFAALQFQRDFFNVRKERVNEFVKFFAVGGERERAGD